MKIDILMFILILVLVLGFGFFAGVSFGSISVVEKTAYALSGSTFIVNLNETRLIDEMNKTIVPQMVNELKQKGEKNG